MITASGQAILVRYLGPTNYRGTRYKASCGAGSTTLAADYALNPRQNAEAAVAALLHKLEWDGVWAGGELPNGDWAFARVVWVTQ